MSAAITARPWDGIISEDEKKAYRAAGFGRPTGIGKRPALLIIDVQYRTVGTRPMPFWEAIKEFPTSCGDVAWGAVHNIAKLLKCSARTAGRSSIPTSRRSRSFDAGRLSDKVPAIMNIAARGYDFVAEIAPEEKDLLLPKKHPSAFFGTPLASYLINLGADTLVVTGCSTSGCVRGTVVDGFAYNFRVLVPQDAVFDRSTSHTRSICSTWPEKYADVMATDEAVETLGKIERAS